jgi:hypothetical protein
MIPSGRIYPDFNKLNIYFNLSQEDIDKVNESGVEIEELDEILEWIGKDKLSSLFEKFELQDHSTELIYLILRYENKLQEVIEGIKENYEDEHKSIQVAEFLLRIKEAELEENTMISFKTSKGTSTIKDSTIAKWMGQLIYDALEAGNMPFDIFGMKLQYDLFEKVYVNGDKLTLERLKHAANIKPKSTKVRTKALLVEVCLIWQAYLEANTYMTRDGSKRVTNRQASFFFELFCLLGYIDVRKVRILPRDYINSMFKNYALSKL